MKQVLVAGIFLLLNLTTRGQVNQHGPPCGGMDIVDVGVHIKGQKLLDYNGIPYSEISASSLRKGFIIALSDTSYKVKGFLIDYKGSSSVKEYQVSGTKVTANNASFIKMIKPGDQLSLVCINIQKESVTKLSTGFRIIVTN
jgi:hypothetical protein